MLKYALIALLCSTPGYGNSYHLMYGVGANSSRLTDSRFIAIGHEWPAWSLFRVKTEGGIYHDNTQNSGAIGFISPSIGVATPTYPLYLKVFLGPALITQEDSRLTSILQFNHDIELGLRGETGVSVGINYKHLSNAGLWGANLGRDAFLLKLNFSY